eukprot:1240135-Lingulodinium_polyedra.AAC.1
MAGLPCVRVHPVRPATGEPAKEQGLEVVRPGREAEIRPCAAASGAGTRHVRAARAVRMVPWDLHARAVSYTHLRAHETRSNL